MTSNSAVRRDNRLDEMPMMPVACRDCGARVLARKSSWNQTSVQWNADATARCAERAAAQRLSAPGGRGVFLACSALTESILDAVRRGELAVVDEMNGMDEIDEIDEIRRSLRPAGRR
ncbi:ferredoxin [Mycobacterium sp. 663a-19]|uniref:ferredoxin n=1 Tax=Mycobacterium sp. 663a-19 TaxID=2986148 RepID=UPI002D1EF732|nr:ferredoxin [Mycobacterium sp. 663a-19]MEB3981793.1 ferredoxin [Mycobacterium sp. 663a-19]